MNIALVEGQQSFKAVEIGSGGVDALLLEVVCKNIQYHILTGDNELRLLLLLRSQEGGVGIDVLDRAGGVLVTGSGDVGVHIVLGESYLTADLIGVDLTFSDEVVNGGFADMEDVSHLLGGE